MMCKISVALAIVILAVQPAVATDKQDVMAVLQQWLDGFNKGDAKLQLATCADETSIIDDIPPHEWHGAGACARWRSDYDAYLKKREVIELTASFLRPRHIDVTPDVGYVVVPMSIAFKHSGKDFKETGSIFTLALKKGTSGWRITGWTYAAH